MAFQVSATGTDVANGAPSGNWKNKLKSVKNLSIIVFIFAFSWSPYMIQATIMSSDPVAYLERPLPMAISYVFLLLLFVNSLINPMVYAVRFRPFRVAFKIMFGLLKEEDRHAAIESITAM